MKNFGKNILLFLIPLVIFIVGFDIYLWNINSIYKEKEKGLISNEDSIEILILGNSHANYGVDPKQFTLDAYNIANVNQSIYFDKRLTLKYLNNLSKLKYVLISVDYHSLYFSSQGIRDIWSYYGNNIKYKNKSYLLPEISPFLFGYTPKVSVALLKKYIINTWKFKNENIIDFNVEEGINLQDSILKGFITFEGTNELEFQSNVIKNRAESFVSKGLNKSIKKEQEEILADLEGFIAILKNKGIKPILFASPCYIDFNSYLHHDILLNNKQVINDLCQKFNIQFLDYSNSKQFYKSDFYNSDHLNKTGGAKFGKILNIEILKMKNIQN